ncbi:MAG: hypothetical protein ACP5LF_05315 [Nitrososphaeria archaeon]|nr:hypothetical protein [Conexivisphaerales archaeon]
MGYHELLAVGYVYTFEAVNKPSQDYLKIFEVYKTKGECLATPEFLAFLHSLNINFGKPYVEMSDLIGFRGKLKAEDRSNGLSGDAYVFFRSFPENIYSIIVIIMLNPKALTINNLIEIQTKSLWKIEGIDIESFINSFIKNLKLKTIYSERYSAIFLSGKENFSEKEIYGLVELDPGYSDISTEILKEVITKNASMVDGVSLYYSVGNMVVIFHKDPLEKFLAITNLNLSEFFDKISSEFDQCKLQVRDVNPHLAIFIDYLVEIEPLRLQHLLLSVYEMKIKLGSKSKHEMARLKADITDMLDFYYVISSVIYKGVKRALILGEKEMGIVDLKRIFDEKMDLMAESIEMYHELEIERWNVLFTYILAAMGFASLALIYLINFYAREGPFFIALLLIFSTVIFIFITLLLFPKVLKRE